MERVIEHVLFKCESCADSMLISKGACLSEKGNIFFVYHCVECEAQVNIEMQSVVAELYNGRLAPGSNRIN